ncbi:MAG: hypothetical protein PWP51_1045 [Clostridiales bacterium]|nr:hypothetical protein [Clostridiales bacterium]MDN5298492.1 hypothetical protein [Clostridiales bacterium]
MTISSSNALSTPFDQFETVRHTCATRHYFKSLCDRFLQNQLDRIESETYALLASLLSRYTLGESSSVPAEFAENVLVSILYTIGIGLKPMSVINAVNLVKNSRVDQLFEIGQKRIRIKINTVKHRHLEVLKTRCPVNNHVYQSTIRGGIKGFLKLYDPIYAAHEIHITADYPTASPRPNSEGVEFIIDYLEAIYLENLILSAFPKKAILDCMRRYHRHYAIMIVNLLDIMMTQALGCLYAGRPPLQLNLSAADAAQLYTVLSMKENLSETIHRGLLHLIALLNLTASSLASNYLLAYERELYHNFHFAIETDTLEQRLCIDRSPIKRDFIFVNASAAMPLPDYRRLYHELISCRHAEDQCQLLLKDVHNFRDLENLLLDVPMPPETLHRLFRKLPDITLAALLVRHPVAASKYDPDENDSDRALRQALSLYMQSLAPDEHLSLHNLSASVTFKQQTFAKQLSASRHTPK